MKKGDYLDILLRSQRTVFTFKDISLLWGDVGNAATRVRVSYYVKNGSLVHLRRGLYAKDSHYNRFEAATKIFTPAYISFETVLGAAGVTFQYYGQIFVASYQSKEIVCDDQKYSFRKIKNSILTNSAGITIQDTYSIATPERAFLDVLYLNRDYHFDHLGPLNWKKVYALLPLYDNQRMQKKVKEFFEHDQSTK